MKFGMPLRWYGMVAFLYSEGIQLTNAHSGGRRSDLTQEEGQHIYGTTIFIPRDSILTSLVLMHAGYLFSN